MIGAALFVLMQVLASTVDPLAPAAAGLLQCVGPDDGQKTCQALGALHPVGEGKYRSSTVALIPVDPPMTAELSAIVESKNEGLCGIISARDLASARIKRAGRPLPERQQAAIRMLYAKALAPMMNKEACTVFEDTPEGLVARTKVDGIHDAGLDQFVKWVHPTDGYRVGP